MLPLVWTQHPRWFHIQLSRSGNKKDFLPSLTSIPPATLREHTTRWTICATTPQCLNLQANTPTFNSEMFFTLLPDSTCPMISILPCGSSFHMSNDQHCLVCQQMTALPKIFDIAIWCLCTLPVAESRKHQKPSLPLHIYSTAMLNKLADLFTPLSGS